MSISRHIRKLNSHGSAHLVLPLLALLLIAIGGSFVMVSNRSKDLSTAATAAAKPAAAAKTKKGYLVIYAPKDVKKDSVKITYVGNQASTHTCGGAFTAANNYSVTKKLNSKVPLKISCAAVSGASDYQVYFGKAGSFKSGYVSVNIDGGYCTLVHVNPATTRLVAIKNGKCNGSEPALDGPEKANAVMRVLPNLNLANKKISGYVEVSVADVSLQHEQCAGQVSLTLKSTTDYAPSFNLPLRYSHPANRNAYCAAKISIPLTSLNKGVILTAYASFPGNKYLNPVSGAAANTVTTPLQFR
jgi:uncharacterized protein (UPF0333 family)